MRRSTIANVLAASALATMLTAVPPHAMAQQPATKPTLSIDPSQLPPLPPIIPESQREQTVLVATGAGAAIGVILADIVTGGLLLAPLGVPSAISLVGLGGGAAAAAPTYSVAQRFLGGVATIAAAVGGGYIGGYFARSRPDLVGLQE